MTCRCFFECILEHTGPSEIPFLPLVAVVHIVIITNLQFEHHSTVTLDLSMLLVDELDEVVTFYS